MNQSIGDLQIKLLFSGRETVTTQWKSNRLNIQPYNRFYYVVKGQAKVMFDHSIIPLKAGHGYLLPTGHPIRLIPPTATFDHIFFHFKAHVFGGIDLFSLIDCPREISGELLRKKLPPDWISSIKKNDENPSRITLLEQRTILNLLLLPFIEAGVDKNPDMEAKYKRFEKVISYIEAHYAEKIKIGDLAAKAFLQSTYFSNVFAREFGMGPKKYICQVRINNAQNLLEHTDLPVKEIADKVGCEELYFSRLFREYVGLTPTEYRTNRSVHQGH